MVATDAGDFRIIKTDASETVRQVLFEAASENLNISTDLRQQLIVPMSLATMREDDKIILEYKAIAATTVKASSSTIRIPIRKKNVRTDNVAESFLRVGDFMAADATVGTASSWTKIGTYTIAAQEEVRLGQSIAENSRIYCDFVEV